MTIGKESTYFGGMIRGEWDDLPSGTTLQIKDKGFVNEIKVVDPNTISVRAEVDGNVLEETLVADEINATAYYIGPSNFGEKILGKKTYLYWDPDVPDRNDDESLRQIVWYPQPAKGQA